MQLLNSAYEEVAVQMSKWFPVREGLITFRLCKKERKKCMQIWIQKRNAAPALMKYVNFRFATAGRIGGDLNVIFSRKKGNSSFGRARFRGKVEKSKPREPTIESCPVALRNVKGATVRLCILGPREQNTTGRNVTRSKDGHVRDSSPSAPAISILITAQVSPLPRNVKAVRGSYFSKTKDTKAHGS